MQVLYHLTDEQRDFLFNTEVELEIQGSEPKQDKLEILLDLVEKE